MNIEYFLNEKRKTTILTISYKIKQINETHDKKGNKALLSNLL